MINRFISLLTLFTLPSLAQAALLMPPGTDKSMEYLGMVFGAVGGLPLGTGTPLFSQMLQVFNQVILILAFIVIAYVTVVSAINTAQEGELLGKKLSMIWIPVRVAAGIFLLVPSASGYSYIQVFMMWFIVNGVGLADRIWEQVIASTMASGQSIVSVETHSNSTNSTQVVNNILKSRMCATKLNEEDLDLSIDEPITIFRDGDIIGWGYSSTSDPICGYVAIPSFSSYLANAYANLIDADLEEKNESKKSLFYNAIASVDDSLKSTAYEALYLDKDEWSLYSSLSQEASFLDAEIINLTTVTPNLNEFDDISEGARRDGWIHAGSYYFKLVAGASYQLQPPNITTAYTDMSLEDEFGTTGKEYQASIYARANNYILSADKEYTTSPSRNTSTERWTSGGVNGLTSEAATAYNAIFGDFFSEIALLIIDYIHHSDKDPIVSMGMIGSSIVLIVEGLLFAAAIGVFALQLVAGVMSCCNPLASAVDFVVGTIMPVALGLLLMTWAGGMSLAIYVPLIPYLVFTFAAFSWFFLVIEAMVAAPLVALGLVIPSEDEIGKAATGVMLVMNIFLRPALMVVGFIIGSKLVTIAVGMLNFGFSYVLLVQITGIGLFGAVAVICLYSALCLAILHECFSMIYILPDKVMTWMGGQAEHSKVMDNVKQAKGYQEKGASTGSSILKGAVSGAGQLGSSLGKSAGSAGSAAGALLMG